MNTIKSSVLALALTLGSMTYANNNSSLGTDPSTITQEISKMLDKHEMQLAKEFTTKVTFTVNKSHEIVVVDVDSDNKKVVNYIKSRLNYKKIKAATTCGKMYFLPVKIEKP